MKGRIRTKIGAWTVLLALIAGLCPMTAAAADKEQKYTILDEVEEKYYYDSRRAEYSSLTGVWSGPWQWPIDRYGEAYVIFKTQEPISVASYGMVSKGDTAPRQWKLYGSKTQQPRDGDWDDLSIIHNRGGTVSEDWKEERFDLTKPSPKYSYFMLVVTKTMGASEMLIGDFTLYDYVLGDENQPVGVMEQSGTGAENILDGDNSTSWKAELDDELYVTWKAEKPIAVDNYVLTLNVGDSSPKSWALYGSNSAAKRTDKSWVELHRVTNDTIMRDEWSGTVAFCYELPQAAQSYQNFMLVVEDVRGADSDGAKELYLAGLDLYEKPHRLDSECRCVDCDLVIYNEMFKEEPPRTVNRTYTLTMNVGESRQLTNPSSDSGMTYSAYTWYGGGTPVKLSDYKGYGNKTISTCTVTAVQPGRVTVTTGLDGAYARQVVKTAYDPYTDKPYQYSYMTYDTTSFTYDYEIMVVSPEAPIGFVDVKPNDYFLEAVDWAFERGVTSGTGDSTFSPHNNCTRGQIITFLWRACGSPAPEAALYPYSDVARNAYYYKPILWAYQEGILTDTPSGTFGADQPCTRSEAMLYMWRMCGSPSASLSSFSDVPANAEYAQAVGWAVSKGITGGTSATTFSPDQTCTRGQIVTFLYKMVNSFG